MSLEQYAIHIAPRGGKIDQIVDEINAARDAAYQKRLEYSRAKGAIGLYQTEAHVSGLLFKDEASVPENWAITSRPEQGVIACPKAKDRTKVSREAVKAIQAEIQALPALPDSGRFTKLIGSDQVIAAGEDHRFALLSCWYERIGETTFVMTPWTTKADETGENIDRVPPTTKTRIAFMPEGCERVGLSAYYAAKEKALEKKAEAVA